LYIDWAITKVEIKNNIESSIINQIEEFWLENYSIKDVSLLLWCLAKNKVRN
jgi:hypothetical protein